MSDQQNAPQLYLITPVGASTVTFAPLLADILDRFPVACLRLPGAGDEDALGRQADQIRDIAHARDVAVVIEDHVQLALRHGLDGVHLTKGSRKVRDLRKDLGADAIIGAYCGNSRHEGINAAEAGADYVSFGPCGQSTLGHGEVAELELFSWWSEMIEVPVIAEGALTPALIASVTPVTDFIALGPEIWAADDPTETLAQLWR
ncbi:thiamine phosphate synthase [Paracoccus sulfuroxidans]|uniref:Thiamine-phosphate pyrophosphorylase n=1 Tax=Paracoccus sulfuroxidans TaxID=384678 RepID=A0A562NL65_9RHOB|nr:thiamine phosphate synthase [Paracoccus sulfuroxidans]TWI32810.1 thiamine-phosphate pyrophosphorylase [Paracoccus sulfuroxidans]